MPFEMPSHEQPHSEMQTFWLQDLAKRENLEMNSGRAEVALTREQNQQLFLPSDPRVAKVAVCSDGRLAYQNLAYRTPGSGIGRSIEEIGSMYDAAGVEEITSHENCGAAKGLFIAQYSAEEAADWGRVNDFAAEWAEDIAKRTGRRNAGALTKEQLVCAPHDHFETSLYVVQSEPGKCFRPLELREILPHGFVASSGDDTVSGVIGGIQKLIGIGFGAEGHGNRFTEDSPFDLYLVNEVVQDHEISGGLRHMAERSEGRIKVIEFSLR